MTGNEPVIQPIQNGEAVIILDCQNELQKLAIEYDDMYLMPRINVHDDLTFIVPEQNDRIDQYLTEIERVMTKIRYRWQIVPLIVEASVGYNWCDMEAIHVHEGGYMKGSTVPPPPASTFVRDPFASFPHARSDAAATSIEAAEAVDVSGQALRVLAVYRDGQPYLDHDAYRIAGLSVLINGARPRCSDLRHAGFIERTGGRAATPSGRAGYVCVITEAGRNYLKAMKAMPDG